MSGLKPQALIEFYWSLHARGKTTELLAEDLGVSGGAVRRLISGHRKRRGPIWANLSKILTPAERELLAQVEQSSTWNTKKKPTSEIFSVEKKGGARRGPDDDSDEEECEPVTMEARA